jgi:hypothetical protein
MPETTNPFPVTDMELIVTGTLPVEVKMKCWVAVVFTFTFPNARLAVLAFNAPAAGFN